MKNLFLPRPGRDWGEGAGTGEREPGLGETVYTRIRVTGGQIPFAFHGSPCALRRSPSPPHARLHTRADARVHLWGGAHAHLGSRSPGLTHARADTHTHCTVYLRQQPPRRGRLPPVRHRQRGWALLSERARRGHCQPGLFEEPGGGRPPVRVPPSVQPHPPGTVPPPPQPHLEARLPAVGL